MLRNGRLLQGRNLGANWLQHYSNRREVEAFLNAQPFPGTMKLLLCLPIKIENYHFLDETRTYFFPVKIYDLLVLAKWSDTSPNVVQIISNHELRKKFSLNNWDLVPINFGDSVTISMKPISIFYTIVQLAREIIFQISLLTSRLKRA